MAAKSIQIRGSSCTKLKAMETFYTWKIKNYLTNEKKSGEVIKSDIFSAKAPGSPEWQMKMYPKGEDEHMKDCTYVSVYLLLVKWRKSKPLNAKVTFAIVNSDGTRSNEQSFESIFNIDQGRGFEYFIKETDLLNPANKLLTYDTLIIECNVAYSDEAIPIAPSSLTNSKMSVELNQAWTVENFTTFAGKTGASVKSSICSTGLPGAPEWQVTMYPKGKMEECSDYISLFVKLTSWDDKLSELLKARVKFSILNSNREKEKSKMFDYEFAVGSSMGSPSFIQIDYLVNNAENLLPNGHLTLIIEISYTAAEST